MAGRALLRQIGRQVARRSGDDEPERRSTVPGTFGRYSVLGEVARGGMGLVLRAQDPVGTPVALKLLLQGKTATERQRGRFRREAEVLLRLRHPGVVALLEAGELEGTPFLAMEWVEGESLEARLQRDGPLDPRPAAELVLALARALEHCHQHGVLHRDLKPGSPESRARGTRRRTMVRTGPRRTRGLRDEPRGLG